MTQQEAKIELKQIRTYYNRIAERKQRLAELRSSLSTIKITNYGTCPARGTTQDDQCRLESAIDRATKLETKIANDIIAMAETQQTLVQKIERLPDPYATVLTRRYIHLERLEKIASDLNYSFYYLTKRLFAIAIKKYAEL